MYFLEEKEAVIEFDGEQHQLEDFVQYINNIDSKFTGIVYILSNIYMYIVYYYCRPTRLHEIHPFIHYTLFFHIYKYEHQFIWPPKIISFSD